MLLQLALVITLAFIHAYAAKILRLKEVPRSAALSFAGGVSVAYVFILIFPELVEAQETLSDHEVIAYIEHHAYLVALVGLTVFYGLERWVKRYRRLLPPIDDKERKIPGIGVFWLHITSFSLYNALVGYLLVYREGKTFELTLFVLAMGFHFLVNDHGLLKYHRQTYIKWGRWILSGAVICGWLIGQLAELSEAATSVLFAFLAGSIILNVLKEELPEERQSRFLPFACGAGIYAALLLIAS